MRRRTHLLLGAAAGSLVAASASLPVVAGAVWLGVAGGGYPDWLDLRSELRGSLRLRHRGGSHGLPVAGLVTGLIYLTLTALADGLVEGPAWMRPSAETASIWTLAFAAGIATHLLADAMTHAGIRPLLPFSPVRIWVLPRPLRGRSDGPLNALAVVIGVVVIGFVIVGRVAGWLGG